jgi:hypothetical protein
MQCKPPFLRPDTYPVIRSVVANGEEIYVEHESVDGIRIAVLSVAGTYSGEFAVPDRDRTVQWAVRGKRLALVREDPDGLQEVVIYEIQR